MQQCKNCLDNVILVWYHTDMLMKTIIDIRTGFKPVPTNSIFHHPHTKRDNCMLD